MGYLNQILCTLIASYLCFIMGLSYAWPSSTQPLFKSSNTTLARPMGPLEIGLLSSLSSVGALISTPLIGMLLDVVGRKYCAVGSCLMSVVAWTIIATCKNVEVVLAAVFISGIGGASILVVPVFVGEICQESIRGTMTSSTMISYGIGILVSYILGGVLEYKLMVYVCLSLTVFGIVIMLFLRETPLYLMKKGLEREAQKSFAFYRNAAFDSKIVLEEMEKLRRAFNPVLEDDVSPVKESKSYESHNNNSQEYFIPTTLVLETQTPDNEKLNSDLEQPSREKVTFFKFLKKSRSTRRAALVTVFLITAAVFQGLAVVQVYAETLFSQAIPDMSPTILSAILALTTIVAGIIAAYLTDLCGRRPLMIGASFGTGICCVLLGLQINLHWGPDWMTAALIYVYAAVYTFGAGTIPFVFLAEVFLPEVRSIMSMLVVEWAWLCNFLVLFMYTPIEQIIGLGPVFYIFAGICLISTVVCVFYQPETKGLPVDAIQVAFFNVREKKRGVIYEPVDVDGTYRVRGNSAVSYS